MKCIELVRTEALGIGSIKSQKELWIIIIKNNRFSLYDKVLESLNS